MPAKPLTLAEVNVVVQQLIGLSVSRPWKGHGSALFLEFGQLASRPGWQQTRHVGEAGIHLGWDWRVEDGVTVLYGSSNSRPEITQGIESLRDTAISRISIAGAVPELSIQFDSGQ